MKKPAADKIKKILVFKLCCFGDVTQITPVINTLKENFNGAHITLIASSWINKLTPHLNNVDNTIIYSVPFEKGFINRTIKTVQMVLKLRKEKFDLAFLGHRKSVFGLILKMAGIKYRLGFSETGFINAPANFDHESHTVARQLKILEASGIPVKDTRLTLKPSKPLQDIRGSLNISREKSIIGIFPFGGSNPGTSMDIKKWDIEKYSELTSMLARKYPGNEIIVFEGSGENEKMVSFEFPGNVRKMVVDIDLISACSLFISGDTGPLYIAEALNVSTLSLFGPTDPVLYAPRNIYPGIIHKYLWKNPSCSPCYTTFTAIQTGNKKYWHDKTFICHTGTHECLNELSTKEVFDSAEKMMQKLITQTP